MAEDTGEQFLHKQDPKLHTIQSVEHEQMRRRIEAINSNRKTSELISQKPADKIAAWLGVVEKTHMGHKDDPRVIERIKNYYHKEYVITPENIPQSYWNLQGEIAISEGRKQDLVSSGVFIEENTIQNPDGTSNVNRSFIFPEEIKEQAVRTVIANQEQSLDKWVDYLSSNDAQYSMWAKYWAFRSIVRMGKLEKTEDGRARFATRRKDTVASFPVLNPRALANTIGAINARLEEKGKPMEEQTTENLSTTLSDEEYQKLLSTEDFSKLYAQFLSEIPEYSTQGLEDTRGEWIKYSQGSNPQPLVASLEGHPLEWCTADIDTARTQLEGGDFLVYYSFDQNGKPIPRLAIRMEESRIAEVRGIAPNQNLDPYITPVLEKKLEEFGSEGQAFKKRTADMKRLTQIEQGTLRNQEINTDDLRFLYELDSPIEGFGYEIDPRIAEILSKRNVEEDMPIVFGCENRQIARSIKEIRPDTKAYVGKLEPGIFDLITRYNIEQIYTSFPEGKIRRQADEIGGKTKEELRHELKLLEDEGTLWVNDWAISMMDNPKFTTLPTQDDIQTVRLTLQDLGFDRGTPTTDQIFKRAGELGLELCPAELGVHRRLKDLNQPEGDEYYIGMDPIDGSEDFPSVFYLNRDGGGLELGERWARPGSSWHLDDEFIFSLRKSSILK